MSDPTASRHYRYLDLITAVFVANLIISNVVASKIFNVHGALDLSAGALMFPISYIFGDVLTEVYGYRRSRRVIWTGFACLAFAALMIRVAIALPSASFYTDQAAYEAVLGSSARLAISSMVAYFAGEFCNSYVMARMKVITNGKHLWARTIASTVVGEGVDTIIVVYGAFYLVFDSAVLPGIVLTSYLWKVGVEVVLTPVTYRIVAALKRAENEDFYDRGTNFNPFRFDRPG